MSTAQTKINMPGFTGALSNTLATQAWTPDGTFGLARNTNGAINLIDKNGTVSAMAFDDDTVSSILKANPPGPNLMTAWNTFRGGAHQGGQGGQRHTQEQHSRG